MTELELCWGTVLQAGLAEFIGAAARAEFSVVTNIPLLVLRSGLARRQSEVSLHAPACVRQTYMHCTLANFRLTEGTPDLAILGESA